MIHSIQFPLQTSTSKGRTLVRRTIRPSWPKWLRPQCPCPVSGAFHHSTIHGSTRSTRVTRVTRSTFLHGCFDLFRSVSVRLLNFSDLSAKAFSQALGSALRATDVAEASAVLKRSCRKLRGRDPAKIRVNMGEYG